MLASVVLLLLLSASLAPASADHDCRTINETRIHDRVERRHEGANFALAMAEGAAERPGRSGDAETRTTEWQPGKDKKKKKRHEQEAEYPAEAARERGERGRRERMRHQQEAQPVAQPYGYHQPNLPPVHPVRQPVTQPRLPPVTSPHQPPSEQPYGYYAYHSQPNLPPIHPRPMTAPYQPPPEQPYGYYHSQPNLPPIHPVRQPMTQPRLPPVTSPHQPPPEPEYESFTARMARLAAEEQQEKERKKKQMKMKKAEKVPGEKRRPGGVAWEVPTETLGHRGKEAEEKARRRTSEKKAKKAKATPEKAPVTTPKQPVPTKVAQPTVEVVPPTPKPRLTPPMGPPPAPMGPPSPIQAPGAEDDEDTESEDTESSEEVSDEESEASEEDAEEPATVAFTVNDPEGKQYTFDLPKKVKIIRVKQHVLEDDRYPASSVDLLKDGQRLPDEATMAESGVRDGDTLQLVLKSETPAAAKIGITVNDPEGKQYTFDIDNTVKIIQVKQGIESVDHRYPAASWDLFKNGQKLGDEGTMAESDVKDGDILQLVLKSEGAPKQTKPPKKEEIELHVHTLDEKQPILLKVVPSDTIRQIKEKIHKKDNRFMPDDIDLMLKRDDAFFKGFKTLNDDTTVPQDMIRQQRADLWLSYKPRKRAKKKAAKPIRRSQSMTD
ncbi:unnamed protein product [Vitrella brassicaformis CCMP3155]|uniref:Ubiquitin-like domain-containing protein n=1 Tax=Vitrella brassicaformis (strain CCMP3155) TaxID=1169540 RepID=A0A0G4EQ23_VITBC|nr:unnamed protein product [Vitrella brassicaformis CCMP3155]|eukprot:CEL99955.1 unnamed protein product [Vitrella brassicaformis CCMP3155]